MNVMPDPIDLDLIGAYVYITYIIYRSAIVKLQHKLWTAALHQILACKLVNSIKF